MAAGNEVGSRIGAREPVTEFDPEPCEHPELLLRARRLDFVFPGLHASAVLLTGEGLWRFCIGSARGWMCTKTA